MWTSQRDRSLPVREPEAELGMVTLGGDPAGVNMGGERRQLPVYAPGGYCWRPAAGERVLVLKAGAEGESPCVLGREQDQADLAPGEVRITGGDSAVYLGKRRLELVGELFINGTSLEKTVQKIIKEMPAGPVG